MNLPNQRNFRNQALIRFIIIWNLTVLLRRSFLQMGGHLLKVHKTIKGTLFFFTLNSPDRFYMAAAKLFKRGDLSGAFNRQYLDDGGIVFLAFTDFVKNGKYELGLAIRNAKGQLTYQPIGIPVIIKNNN